MNNCEAKRIANENRKLAKTMMLVKPSVSNDVRLFEKTFSNEKMR